jgi:SAM-dependent methyltransferase
MKRWDIINRFISEFGYEDYLEIGLQSGMCRDNVNVKNKTTVDPDSRSNNPTHLMTSDEFFLQNEKTFDIIFIDGLHHGDQVYKDILNALEVLKPNGTILCHDMLPDSDLTQRVPRETEIWTGNCWQAWAKLKATRDDLSMFILETDWGVGVIRKGVQIIQPSLDTDFSNMDWDFYQKHKGRFDYVPTSYLEKHLEITTI